MTKAIATLSNIKRPKLIIRAARSGTSQYQRSRFIKQYPSLSPKHSSETFLNRLLIEENEINQSRHNDDPAYNVRKHIAVLTAILAEANSIPQQTSVTLSKAA